MAYENKEVDQLLEAGAREMDQEKRKKIYHKLQEVLADDLPYLPIHHYVIIRATKASIQGFQPNSNMQDYTWNRTSGGSRRLEGRPRCGGISAPMAPRCRSPHRDKNPLRGARFGVKSRNGGSLDEGAAVSMGCYPIR